MRYLHVNDSRPQILAVLPAFNPSAQICIVKPLMRLHQAKLLKAKMTLEYLVDRKGLERADLIVFCRNTEPRYAWILDFILHRHIPFVYDIDDNFFEIPLGSEQGKYYRDPDRLAMHQQYIRSAELVRVYSDRLLERMKTLNTNVEKVSGPIDWGLISPPQSRLRQGPVKLVYATSRIDDRLSALFMPALKRILNQYREKVEVHFWGFKPNGLERVRCRSLMADYDRFLRRFSKAGFDIGLAPLDKDVFHQSKTNNKFREYGSCQIAGIYSNMEVYSACVEDEETGLLVSNETDSWYRAMVRLIENHDLREKIKRQALEYIRLHYPDKNFEKIWWSQIQRGLTRNKVGSDSNPLFNGIRNQKEMISYYETLRRASRLAYLQRGGKNLIRHINNNGVKFTIRLFRSKLYDRWMVFKLWFGTSSFIGIFNRK